MATASANGKEGRDRGRPKGVRSLRLSSVTVYQFDDVELGLRWDAQLVVFDIDVVTPVALCVPSTPAEIGDCTSSIELLFPLLLDVVIIDDA